MRFPFVRPEIPSPAEWVPLLDTAYERRYFTNFGSLETEFSRRLAEKFADNETEVTLACNATAALTAALIANDVIGPVAIPDFTFPATLTAVLAAGCEPVICEVDADTGEIDVGILSNHRMANRLKAIMPVRAYGFVRNLEPLIKFAENLKIPVIVDSAAALGATKVMARAGVTEVFSLHATKSFAIGEGGAIFHRRELKSRIVSALNFGLRLDRRFGLGLNGKMSEFQAAVGLAQLQHIDRLVASRRQMAEWYFGALSAWPEIRYPTDPGLTPWSNFPVFLPIGVCAEGLQSNAADLGYQIRRYYYPTLSAGFILNDRQVMNPVSQRLSEQAICLPIYSDHTEKDRELIGDVLVAIFRTLQ